jgi:4-hydroxybenzoate polyprenyltransferase/Flp pilus assembly protein TadD
VGPRPAALRAFIRSLEASGPGAAPGILLFLSVVTIRNLLEGILEKGRFIGFVSDAPVSGLMIFDHYLVFYAALFVVLALAISAVTRFPIRNVLRVLLAGWVLILVPPIVDVFASAGRGFSITYIPDLLPTAAAFFDPRADLAGVSIGQRVEILLGIVLVGGYAWAGGAGIARAAAAAVLFYAVITLFGALPVLVARIPFGAGAAAADPVTAVYRSGGVIQHESQKHALLFLLVLLGAGSALLARLHPEKATAVRRNARPLRTAHYAGLALAGCVFGGALVGPYLGAPPVAHVLDAVALAALVLSVALAFHAGAALNDLSDVRADRVSEPGRPLASGTLDRRDVGVLALLSAGASLLLAFNVAHVPFLLVLLSLVLSVAYSTPPLRLKRFPGIATAVLGAVSATVFVAGFSAFAGGRAFHVAPRSVLLSLFLGIALGFTAKDLKDVEGDRADGVWTIPTLLGERSGRRATAALVAAGFLVPAVILPVREAWLVALPLAAAACLLTLRVARPDRPLLALTLGYACVLLALLLARIDAFRAVPEAEARGLSFDGMRLLYGGESAAAAGRFDASARADGATAAAFGLERGAALAGAGRPSEAISVLLQVLEERPHEKLAWTTLAECRLRAGDREGARRTLTAMRARGVDPPEAVRRLAGISLEEGDLARADGEIEEEARLGVREEDVALHRGDRAVLSGDAAGAARHYREAIRFDPRSASAWGGLGRAEHAAGRLHEARAAFDRALEIEARDAVLWNNAGVVDRDRGEKEGALIRFERARKLDPNLLQAYMNRGALLEDMGNREEAAREYDRLLRVVPGFDPAVRARARLSGEGPPRTGRVPE